MILKKSWSLDILINSLLLKYFINVFETVSNRLNEILLDKHIIRQNLYFYHVVKFNVIVLPWLPVYQYCCII